MTDLIDLYVAAGGTDNGDGTVTMSNAPQTFDVLLKVILTGLEVRHDEPATVVLSVVQRDLYMDENGRELQFPDIEIELPVNYIRLPSTTTADKVKKV